VTTKVVDVSKTEEYQNLPPTQRAYHFSYTDSESGLDYSGVFVFRRLNVGDMRGVAVRTAELNGGMPQQSLDRHIAVLNEWLASLEHAIVKAPEWWKPNDFYTADIIGQVYAKFEEFEATFRGAVRGRPSAPAQDSEGAGGHGGASAPQVVDAEVPPAANA